ncbi:MAG: DegT/DnrJ/EryC1/StrS family aminotransferase, partial [Deltaproteobacteria bacterium]|nr:DegT/DnrJ/EryC1/StrS family aminotransferase [Deltaproteobacteria bacterium]
KALVPVHYGGVACEMEALMEIAGQHGLMVVEDAAQALLSRYKDRPLGTIGHLGGLSFHETKNVISGEGGALLVNRPELAGRAEIIREKGTDRPRFLRGELDKYTWQDIGSSFLPSELVGAFLCAQLEHAEEIDARRKRLWERYMELLAPLQEKGRLTLRQAPAHCQSGGHLMTVLTASPQERDLLLEWLNSQGIGAVFHYVPLHSSPAGRRYGRTAGKLEVTDRVSQTLIRLPLFYQMTDDDVERVTGEIEAFFRSR